MAKKKEQAKVVSENTAAEEASVQAEEAEAENAVETDIQEPDKVAELEAALNSEHEKYLRLAAEYDNYRKRSLKERDALRGDIRSGTISELLPIYDNLARALAAECSDEAFYKGVELTMTQLKSIFESMGVTEIPAVGETFDPTVHNAIMHIEDDKYESGIIVQEFQKGFKLGDKVIRFSMVQVAN